MKIYHTSISLCILNYIILFEKYIWENKKLFQLINLLEFNESTLRHKWREHYNIHGFLALKRFIMQKVQTG